MIDFPDAPTLDQIFTAGNASWQWDGTKWSVYSAPVVTDYLVLRRLSVAPVVAGAGTAFLYAIQGTGTTATVRLQAGTDAEAVDLIVNVGGGF
jgi:hypothetical protein